MVFSKKISTFALRDEEPKNMWNERYNETRKLKRRMEARLRKAERLKALRQVVEQQEYLNDSRESLEYYLMTHPVKEIEVWDGGNKQTFCCVQCAAKHFNLDVSMIRKLVNGTYASGKHTKGRYYFAPKGYCRWLGKQKVKVPNLEEEIRQYVDQLKKGFDT